MATITPVLAEPVLQISATHPCALSAVRYWVSLVDHAGLPKEKAQAKALLVRMMEYRDQASKGKAASGTMSDDRGATPTQAP